MEKTNESVKFLFYTKTTKAVKMKKDFTKSFPSLGSYNFLHLTATKDDKCYGLGLKMFPIKEEDDPDPEYKNLIFDTKEAMIDYYHLILSLIEDEDFEVDILIPCQKKSLDKQIESIIKWSKIE